MTEAAGDDATVSETAAELGRGTNQIGVRLYNERLVLSLIRRHGSLPKAQIARLTGLSAQTASVIVAQLARDGLVTAGARQRGRVGQPSVPFALEPDGAFALGFKVGRRSADVVLIDFVGRVRATRRTTYSYPVPDSLVAFGRQSIAALTGGLPETLARRVAGLGIAAPFELWSWTEAMGAPGSVADAWRSFDLQRALAGELRGATLLCNDATAACGAELVLGRGGRFASFVYFFVGSFVGGGVVLDGSLLSGRTGNAGALGSMLVSDAGQGPRQLIHRASLYVLERRLQGAGQDPAELWRNPDHWEEPAPILDAWLSDAAGGLAEAIVSASSVIDFEAAVIDGAFPPAVRARVVTLVREALTRLDRQGLSPLEVVEGSIGSGARAIGGACLPLLASFAKDREVLFKTAG
jgi:predicted NBD/HSP70 family sugar kinase